MSFQIVSVAISIAADWADVRFFQMRFFVLSQAVHVFEPRRTYVTLHILLKVVLFFINPFLNRNNLNLP